MTVHMYMYSTHEEELNDNEDGDKVKKCEVWWGLSDSSTNLAKELLPSEFVTLDPSRDQSVYDEQSRSNGATSSKSIDPDGVDIEGIDTLIEKQLSTITTVKYNSNGLSCHFICSPCHGIWLAKLHDNECNKKGGESEAVTAPSNLDT